MKSKIISTVSLVMILFILIACGEQDTTKMSDVDSAEVTDSNSEEKISDMEQVTFNISDYVGTFVGLHGSVISLFEDGSAEYYWKEWTEVDKNDSWKLDNKRLIIYIANLGYDIYADLQEGNTSSLTFTSDSQWEDEIFVKVDDNPCSKNVDDCISLIERQLNTTIPKPSDSLVSHIGGYTFSIPEGFVLDETNETKESYSSRDGNAILYMIISPNVSFDDTDLKLIEKDSSNAVKTSEEALDKVLARVTNSEKYLSTKKVFDDIKPPKSLGNTHHYTVSDGSEMVKLYGSWMINKVSGRIVFMVFADRSPQYIYSEDFLSMIETAIIDGAEANEDIVVSQEKNNNKSISGVNEDLKAFLDSYEEFIDEYVEFMKKYKENSSDLELIKDYADIMQRYTDFSDKLAQYDTEEMSKEDTQYYIEVTARCSQKLLEVAY